MRQLVLACLVIAPISAWAQPTLPGAVNPPRSPRNASYAIDARLDRSTRTISGTEVISWRNISARTAHDLQFHLYWNAWKDERSTFMREVALSSADRLARLTKGRRPGDWARIDVTSVALVGGGRPARDLTASTRHIAPDDGNAHDTTVMEVALPEPVGPDGTLDIEVKWTAHVPRPFARTGVVGRFFFIAQWFPKLGVLQDDGWNCHQFHAATEFFSDYGVYDVRLTVPAGWPVGATGMSRESRVNGDGTTTHRFYQEDVHDFAWTTSPDYLVRTARFEDPRLPPVEMRLLIQPEHVAQADRHFDATRAALARYGEWYGAYPYGHLTIVDPAYRSGADGMEYPTLFTVGTNWRPSPGDMEETAVHEAGHQFWYGMVGNNEFEDAWLDEGINQFSTARVVAQVYGPSFLSLRYFGGFLPYVFKDVPIVRELGGNGIQYYRPVAKSDAPSTPSYRYFPSGSVGVTYGKTALWLNTMERWLGWPTVQRMLSTFFGRWTFKHPRPQDFFDAASEVAGRDLGWYFDQVYGSSNVFDYGVEQLQSTSDGASFHTNVVVRRYGEAVFPVDVLVTFRDGERVTEHWDGKERWKLYTYDRPSQALTAAVDPDGVLLLDVNSTNNSKTLEPRTRDASTKWSMKWMVWLQDHLLSWAFFV